jgi:hypothetical protein
VSVVDCATSYARAGLPFRQRTPGPEDDLVERFLASQPFSVPRGCRLTIFREPCIESGFPDLVAVVWRTSTASSWNAERAALTARDVRLMQYVFQQGPCAYSLLKAMFRTKVKSSLDKLQAAKMLRTRGDMWSARPLSRCFAVKSIIAVEAKIDDWRKVLRQALLNTWFASSSYMLLPRVPRGGELLTEAAKFGLGVWVHGESLTEHAPNTEERLPRSYASWLFNEWAWRSSELAGA